MTHSYQVHPARLAFGSWTCRRPRGRSNQKHSYYYVRKVERLFLLVFLKQLQGLDGLPSRAASMA